jgi:K+-transporting ATPase ATPase A chain
MTANGWVQIGFYVLVIFLITKPVGIFLARVFERKKTFLDPVLRPTERLVYRLCGVDENKEMRWTEYGTTCLCSAASPDFALSDREAQQWLPRIRKNLRM